MITVKTAFVTDKVSVEKYKDSSGKIVKGVYRHLNKTTLYGILERDGKNFAYYFTVHADYVGNFASSPDLKLVQMIVPSYVNGDDVYNEGFDLHDWLYSVKGECSSGQVLERSEVDDLARGIMRESPTLRKNPKWLARLRCSLMDVSVHVCAGNKRHWGNDSFNSRDKADFYLVPFAAGDI